MNYSLIMEISLIAGIGFALLALLLFFTLRVPSLIREVTGRSRQIEVEDYEKGQMYADERYLEETLQQNVLEYEDYRTDSDAETEKMKPVSAVETAFMRELESGTAGMPSSEEGTVRMFNQSDGTVRMPAESAGGFRILEREIVVHDSI